MVIPDQFDSSLTNYEMERGLMVLGLYFFMSCFGLCSILYFYVSIGVFGVMSISARSQGRSERERERAIGREVGTHKW